MLGVRVEALPALDRPIEDRTAIRLHTGTVEAVGEIVLLDAERLEPGASGLAQIRLDEAIVTAPGDRFIVRLESPAWTLGGGVILEESKHRLKRFKAFVVEELSRQATSLASPRDLLESVLRRAADRLHSPAELAVEIKRSKEDTERLLGELLAQRLAVRVGPDGFVNAARLEAALERVDRALEAWFGEHGHRQVIDVRDLRRITSFEPEFLDALLAEEAKRGKVAVEPGGIVRPKGRAPAVDEKTEALAASVLGAYAATRFQPPAPAELAARLGAKPPAVQAALELLVDRGDLRPIARDLHLPKEAYEEARQAIVANCTQHGSLDIPKLRDALMTSRKFLIPLLEHFDAQGLTIRQGGHRVLKKR